jgi:hypothetical protein
VNLLTGTICTKYPKMLKNSASHNNWQTRLCKDKTTFGWAAAGQGMTFCDKRGNGGWTNPRLRVQQAAGLRTKVSSKESEQTECPALLPPAQKLVFIFGFYILPFTLLRGIEIQ